MVKYARMFERATAYYFVDVSIPDVVEEIIFFNFLGTNIRESYICYIDLGNMMNQEQGVLSIFERLGKNTPALKNRSIQHLDDLSVILSSKENVILIILATDTFDVNDHKAVPFLASLLYR